MSVILSSLQRRVASGDGKRLMLSRNEEGYLPKDWQKMSPLEDFFRVSFAVRSLPILLRTKGSASLAAGASLVTGGRDLGSIS